MENDQGKPIPGNIPVKVTDTSQYPYRYVGLLEMTFPNGSTVVGTGTLLGGGTYVLTAASNLFIRMMDVKAYSGYFTPALKDADGRPHPPVRVDKVFVPDGYTRGNDENYGLVKLSTEVFIGPGEWAPRPEAYDDNRLKNKQVELNGYGYFGRDMSHATGEITEVTPRELMYPISTEEGAAGTPILSNRDIVGIHTSSGKGNLNCGVRITPSVLKQIAKWG